jgi:hypothetical protein
MDEYQPVLILFATEDFSAITEQCRKASAWMKNNGMKRVTLRELPGSHERKPLIQFDFFRDVLKKYSFIRLSAVKDVGGDPLLVQFYATINPKPGGIIWDFGDGKMSKEESPQHRFPAYGEYDITVTVITPGASRTERKMHLILTDNQ